MPSDRVLIGVAIATLSLWILAGWVCAVVGTAIAYDDCSVWCSDK